MGIQDDVKAKVQDAENLYNTANTEVVGFFARNKFTVVILTGVAVLLVVLVGIALFK